MGLSRRQRLADIEVSYEFECYFERENEAYGFVEDPVEWLRSYVSLLDRADRRLDTQVFDGRECVGFEVSAAKYGDKPKGGSTASGSTPRRDSQRVSNSTAWISAQCRTTHVIIHDQFKYYAQVPADLFVPAIPEGYVNEHPDEVRAARDRQAKGEMVYAEVPEGLRERIIAALKTVNRGSYRQAMTHADPEGNTHADFSTRRAYFVRNAWRTDLPDTGEAQIAHWYVLTGALPEGPFELTDNFSVLETMVNYWEKNYRVIEHTEQHPPRHPMAGILFNAGLINQADRFYESGQIGGIECFGFDVSAKKYGDNPERRHRAYLVRCGDCSPGTCGNGLAATRRQRDSQDDPGPVRVGFCSARGFVHPADPGWISANREMTGGPSFPATRSHLPVTLQRPSRNARPLCCAGRALFVIMVK